MPLIDALNLGATVIAAELRPPRAELDSREGMDAWIDMYHAVRNLARRDVRVFLTDSLSLQVDMRDHIFSLDLLGQRQSTQNLELTGGLTFNF